MIDSKVFADSLIARYNVVVWNNLRNQDSWEQRLSGARHNLLDLGLSSCEIGPSHPAAQGNEVSHGREHVGEERVDTPSTCCVPYRRRGIVGSRDTQPQLAPDHAAALRMS